MNSSYKDAYLNLMPNCRITRGKKRALIQNNSVKTMDLIPLALAEIIDVIQKNNLEYTYHQYESVDHPTLDNYIDFLISKGYAFLTEGSHFEFGKHDNENYWDMPFVLTSCIIDYNDLLKSEIFLSINELADLGCNTLQIRFLNRENYKTIIAVLDNIYGTKKFSSVSLVTDFISSGLASDEALDLLVSTYPVISEIIQYNSNTEKFFENEKLRFKVLYITSNINQNSCGVINPFYFSVNAQHYTESLHHNTCLNRKASIDADGNIKNCPSMKDTFGNIRNSKISDALQSTDFKKFWTINKDQISKCKDCEFRHVCTDCRAFLDKPTDLFSAPLKCGYDPYSCKWDEWSTNPLKQPAIEFYSLG